jgi:hypothetical protein
MITSTEMVAKLQGVQPGAKVFVSYLAGRKPTARALVEAQKAENEGYAKRWFAGTLESVWTTQKGEPVFRVFSHTRYNVDNLEAEGHYRTFNPALGTLLTLEVVQ